MREKRESKTKHAPDSAPCLSGGVLQCEHEHGKADELQIWTKWKTREPHTSHRETRLPFVSGSTKNPPPLSSPGHPACLYSPRDIARWELEII